MVGLVSSVTSLVSRVSGEAAVPLLVPVPMVLSATLPMDSARAGLLTDASALQGGLALTAVCPVMIRPGEQTVTILVCVGKVESAIRYLEYRKIPILNPGLIFVQNAFLLGLFLRELIFGGAYYWKEFSISK